MNKRAQRCYGGVEVEAGSLLKQQQPSRAGLFHSKPVFPTQKTHVLVQNKGQAPRQALRGKQSYLGSPSLIWLTFGLYRLIHPGEMLPQLAFLFISTNWGFGRECSVQNVLFIPKSLRSSLTEIPCYLMCRQRTLSQQTGLPNCPLTAPCPTAGSVGRRGWGGRRRSKAVNSKWHQIRKSVGPRQRTYYLMKISICTPLIFTCFIITGVVIPKGNVRPQR